MNANVILSLEREVALMAHIAQFAEALATDATAMPDGSGTVMSRFHTAVNTMTLLFTSIEMSVELNNDLARIYAPAAVPNVLTTQQPSVAQLVSVSPRRTNPRPNALTGRLE